MVLILKKLYYNKGINVNGYKKNNIYKYVQ